VDYDTSVTGNTREKVRQGYRMKVQSQYSLHDALFRSMQRNTTVKQ